MPFPEPQVRVKDSFNGDTPLHRAAQFGHVEIVVTLFQAGAGLAEPNAAGETPEAVARRAGHTSLADKLRAWCVTRVAQCLHQLEHFYIILIVCGCNCFNCTYGPIYHDHTFPRATQQ